MANIILPAVPVLNEIDDSTKLLIEQAGEINRYPISDLDIGGGDVTIDLSGSSDTNGSNSINADTLGGKPASDYVLKDELILDSIGGSSLDDIKTYVNNQITNRVIHSGGKNLLKNTAKSLTKTGITFTINTDGSVTLNGTATNDCYFTITSGVLLPSGNYILSGCPADGSMDSYILYAAPAEGSNSIDIGNSVAFSTDGTQKYSFTIRVTSGVTITGLTYYPMLRLASETDDTYEPYYEGLMESVSKSQVVNNFVTTEEGFVADARALKVLNDKFNNYEAVNLDLYDSSGTLCATMVITKVWRIVSILFVNQGVQQPTSVNMATKVPEKYRNAYRYTDTVFLTFGGNSQVGRVRIDRDGTVSIIAPAEWMYGNVTYISNEE